MSQIALREVLKGHSFLAGLTDSELDTLSSLASEVSFAENELILRTGQRSQYFYLLLSGSVCIEVRSRAFTVCIQALGSGDAFGWSALLDQHDTLFQVRARERSTALCLEASALTAAFREDPELAAELLRRTLKLVAGRVQATETRLGELIGVRQPAFRMA